MLKINLKQMSIWLAAIPVACILAAVNSLPAGATILPDECFEFRQVVDPNTEQPAYRIQTYNNFLEQCRVKDLTLPTERNGLPVSGISEFFWRVYPYERYGIYEGNGWTQLESIDFNNIQGFSGDSSTFFANIGLKSVTNIGFRVIGTGMFADNNLTTVRLSADKTDLLYFDAFSGNNLETVYIDGVMHSDTYDAESVMLNTYKRAFVGVDYSTEHFVRLYTDDPNYQNVIDFANSQPQAGRLVNPAQVYLKFVDESGNELKPTEEVISRDPNIKNYNITADLGSTVEEIAAKYYFAGQNYTYAPDEIAGYETPAAQSVTLNAERNELTFVYKKAVDSGANSSAGDDASADENSTDPAGDLAQTGVGVDAFLAIAVILVAGGVAVRVRISPKVGR